MTVVCPVCRGMNDGTCRCQPVDFDGRAFDCDMCGSFKVSGTALAMLSDEKDSLTAIQRAALSHHIRSANDAVTELPLITSDWLARFLTAARLPTPGEQAINILRFIGDEVAKTGKPMRHSPAHLWASVGSPNPRFVRDIVKELFEARLIDGQFHPNQGGGLDMISVAPTLAGWERYEAERHGKLHGKYGFIALKFDDPILDPFVRDVIRPYVKAELGFDLVDMRDVSQAGVIDNIMRAQIRDAAFVLVDLTHDNSGAYWEAGYAEGLGKPVVYLCEKVKFDQMKTHFDTNHCTTVLWAGNESEEFTKQLIATLRRSLNLFPTR